MIIVMTIIVIIIIIIIIKYPARYENIQGEKRYSSTHSKLADEMEMSGQIHAPAAFLSRKEISAPINRRMVGF